VGIEKSNFANFQNFFEFNDRAKRE
jgi:hypothetical protein